jgi:hypothetical protein
MKRIAREGLGWRGFILAGLALTSLHCKGKTADAPADAGATKASEPAPSASAAPTGLTTLAGFEGEIDLIAQSGDPGRPTQNVNMLVHNDRIRLDSIPGTDAARAFGGKAYLLLRVPDKKLDIISEPRKQAVEFDLNNPESLKAVAGKASSPATPNGPPEPPPKLTKTGKKETIAGYPCEDWEVTSVKEHKKRLSACVTDLQSTFFHITLPGIPPEYAYAQDLADGQHFPLRVISYDDRTGAESGRLEVTKFDPHPMDASKFEIPAGYAVVDLMQLLGSLPSGPGHVPGMPGLPGIPSNLPSGPQHPHRHH